MTKRKIAKEEKIISHCNALADVIIAIRPAYLNSEPQQRAFIETMIGAAIWYIPKPANAWTGYISREAMKTFHPESGISSPKFSEEHVYPRKVAARLLLENVQLNGLVLFELFNEKYGRLHYITPDENKAVIRYQRDSVFTVPDDAYIKAGIELISVLREDLRKIKKRELSTIEKYLNA